MKCELLEKLSAVLAQYDWRGEVLFAEPWGSGHINDTIRLRVCQGGRQIHYILQRINTSIFPDVAALMDNISLVTGFVRDAAVKAGSDDLSRSTLTLVPSRQGANYIRDDAGGCWRCYTFVEGAHTCDVVSSPDQCREAGRAFGKFQYLLRELPGDRLAETIRDFHNTPRRMEKFKAVLAADKLGRARECQKEIAFALAHEDECGIVTAKLANGQLPLRVTHNDTKINNVMLDDVTGQGVCVIDLDTVMPGSVLYDFGDQIRTSTSDAAEDERDLGKVRFRMEFFRALLDGYLSEASAFLTDQERQMLPFSGRLLTFETGLRFLTDHLEGDVYFKTHRENHNLDRCRTQFELVRQMEALSEQMQALV